MNRQPHTRQNGFSLVELMVALTISLILLAGILQILLGNRQSMDVQRTESDLQDNARLAAFITRNIVARTGYRFDPGQAIERAFPVPDDDKKRFGTGDVITGDSQTLHVRFQASGDFRDCNSSPIGSPGNPATASFELSVENGSFSCNGRPLTPNNSVAKFLVQYGQDTNGDNAVDTYANTPGGNPVLSVRIQILLKSDSAVLPKAEKRHYALANGTIYPTEENRLAYQMVDQTIALRNTLP